MESQIEILKLAKKKEERIIRRNGQLSLTTAVIYFSFRKFRRFSRFVKLSHNISFKYWLLFVVSNSIFFLASDIIINKEHAKDKYDRASAFLKLWKQT